MNEEQFEDHPVLLDDDPALDHILYKDMSKDDRSQGKWRTQKQAGCFSLLLLTFLPSAGLYWLANLLQ